MARDLELDFDDCFDDRKVAELSLRLPAMYAALDALAPWRDGRWPTRVRCMGHEQIARGRSRGAGHGMTYVRGRDHNSIWMNPYMSDLGLFLVMIHENLHHAFPDATEDELNNVLVQQVFESATGEVLPVEAARKAGLGPPEPGIGDRGYVY